MSKGKSAIGTPPKKVKGSSASSGERKVMGPKMGGLFGSMTAKKSEPDNKVKQKHSMRVARLTGKII